MKKIVSYLLTINKYENILCYRCHIAYSTTVEGVDKSWGFVMETDENNQVLRFRWLSEYSINRLVGVGNPYEHPVWKLL